MLIGGIVAVVGLSLLAGAFVFVLERMVPSRRRQHTELQGLAKQYARIVIDVEWPELAQHRSSAQARAAYQKLQFFVECQQPTARYPTGKSYDKTRWPDAADGRGGVAARRPGWQRGKAAGVGSR
ncbi:MAG TPA: hypothetical protein VMG38_09710 [Trebonia sp.]|nr:hypothetical protein [Trebonia sp.]